MKKKATLIYFSIFIFVCCFLSLFLFPRFYAKEFTLWKLNAFCQKTFSSPFSYKECRWESENLVFEEIQIGKEGNCCLIEKALFSPSLSWKKRLIGGKGTLQGVTLMIYKEEGENLFKENFLDSFSRGYLPFFCLDLETEVKGGQLLLYDSSQKDTPLQRIDWDLYYLLSKKNAVGRIALDLEPGSPILNLEFTHSEKGGVHLISSLKSHPIKPIAAALRPLLSSFFPPSISNWKCAEGDIEAEVDATFVKGKIRAFVGKLSLQNFRAANEALSWEAQLDHLFVSYNLDDQWDGHLLIQGGKLKNGFGELKDLSSEVTVKKGVLETTSFFASLLGMEGELQLNWNSPKELAKMAFSGNSKEISSFIPTKFREGFKKAFPNDRLQLQARLVSVNGNLELQGEVLTAASQEKHTIKFGALLEQESQLDLFNGSEEKPLFGEIMRSLKKQFLSFKKGWIAAENLPLEKFLSPFLLGDVNMNLCGRGDFEGEIAEGVLTFNYKAKNLSLVSPHFAFFTNSLEPKLSGFHSINLRTREHHGSLPLEDFSYTQKNFNIHFPKAKGRVDFQGNKISINAIETAWKNLTLKGDLAITIHSLTDVNLSLAVDSAAGPFPTFQKFFSHISDAPFWRVPIEGEISTGKGDIFFLYHFSPKVTLKEGRIAGFSNLSFNAQEMLPKVSFKVNNFTSAFQFDAVKKEVNIEGGEGILISGREGETPVAIKADFLHLTHLPNADVGGDITLKTGEGRESRILFGTQTLNGKKIVTIEKSKSSFGDFQLQLNNFELINWHQIDLLDFSLNASLADLASLAIWMGVKFPVELDQKRVDGTLAANFSYRNSELLFQLHSPQVGWDKASLGELIVEGSFEKERLCLDHFSLGILEVMGDFYFLDRGLEIPFLGIKVVDLGHFSIEGEFQKSSGLKCQISDFSLDMGEMTKFKFLPEELLKALCKFGLKGKLGGQGWLTCKQEIGSPLHFEAETLASFERLVVGGVELGDGENLICTLSSEQGLNIVGLKVEVGKPGDVLPPIVYRVGKCGFDLSSSKLTFEGFDFSFPPARLPWMSHLLKQLIPTLSSNFTDSFEKLKKEESLEGSISFEVASDNYWVHLSLKDGVYFVGKHALALENFSCVFDKNGILCRTLTKISDTPLWVNFQSESLQLSKGSIAICEPKVEEKTLNIFWHKNRLGKFEIEKINGSLQGIEASLLQEKGGDEAKRIAFSGKVVVHSFKDTPLLPKFLRDLTQKTGIGKGYQLGGRFSFARDEPSDLLFSGNLIGKDFEIGGMILSSLEAHLNFNPTSIEFKKVEIKDRGGNLLMDEILFTKGELSWNCHIPHARLVRFRPARLRSWNKAKKRTKKSFQSLLVHNFELSHFSGSLGSPETFRGEGNILFSNYPKKGFIANILLIPADLISRIGLDFALLVPVRGQIWYKIDKAKIDLVRTEEVYSDGKRSRFFLAKDVPSYIDFEGKLNINLKMKQYNLLMKFVELLTMNVSGTINKPSYHLVRHKEKHESS